VTQTVSSEKISASVIIIQGIYGLDLSLDTHGENILGKQLTVDGGLDDLYIVFARMEGKFSYGSCIK
jgi:hypothetical protein